MTNRLHPDDELEGLVRRLNQAAASVPGPPPAALPDEEAIPGEPSGTRHAFDLPPADSEGLAWLHRLLSQARERYATDLLLVVGAPPVVRIHGALEPLHDAPLAAESTATLCAALVPPERRETAEKRGTVDFAIRVAGSGRFRCNVHRERGRWSAAIRLFPAELPELESLHLPASLERFVELQHGLVLVDRPDRQRQEHDDRRARAPAPGAPARASRDDRGSGRVRARARR